LFINREKLYIGKFAWQEGYRGFTYSRSQLENVSNYIHNLEKHHEKSTFKAEYIQFLKIYAIDFDERFFLIFGIMFNPYWV
jgi:putative transposase